jgi:hypothetical protein
MRSILILSIITLLGCSKPELKTEKYSGVWNYTTSQNCGQVLTVEAISDNEVIISWNYCMQGKIKATITGNQIAIPYQNVTGGNHQAVGTITDNSMQFNSYRYGRDGQYWVMKVNATK